MVTLPNITSEVSYLGSAAAVEFPFPYLVLDETHLKVYHDGALQTLGYSVTGIGTDDVAVVYAVPPAAGVEILIRRIVPLTQLSDYVENDPLPAATLEADFDLMAMGLQQLESDKDRTLRVPEGEVVGSMILPLKSVRASQILGFDAGGLPVVLSQLDQSAMTVTPSPGGTPRFLGDLFGDILNVKNFGAAGDGTQDDTAAILAAVASAPLYAAIYFPAGAYVVSSSITVTDRFMTFFGEGPRGSEIMYRGGGRLFDLHRTGDENAHYNIKGLLLNTDEVGVGTAIYVEQDQESGVVGGFDSLHIEGVIIESVGTGYWLKGLEQKKIGGVYANSFTMVNNNLATAQQNSGTIGIHLNNDQPGIFMIRAFHGTNIYIQRYHYGLLAFLNNNQIESVYINNYEILCSNGIVSTGTGQLAAVGIGIGHIDCIVNGIATLGDSIIQVLRCVGADIRCGNNGAPASNATLINLANSTELVTITGCTLFGHTGIGGVASFGVFLQEDVSKVSIAGNVLRDLTAGMLIEGATNNMRFGANTFANCDTNISYGGSSFATSIQTGRYYTQSIVLNLSGGDPLGSVDIAIPPGYFDVKPGIAFLQSMGDGNVFIHGFYQYSNAATTATILRFLLVNNDGSNLPVGLHRFSLAAFE